MLSLGKIVVPTPGTKVRVTVNTVVPESSRRVSAIMLQALPTNTGKVFIVREEWNPATYKGIIAILPPPTTNTFPTFSNSHPICVIDPAGFYVDTEVAGEGVIGCAELG